MVITGADIVFVFQSAVIIIAYFILIHPVFSVELKPRSFLFVLMGLLSVQLTNAVLITISTSIYPQDLAPAIVYGPIIEELVKVFALFYIYQTEEREMRGYILSGTLLGLGFAIGELIGYAVRFGTSVLLLRSVVIIIGHPLFGALIARGWYGLYNSTGKRKTRFVSMVLLALVLHIAWNLIVTIALQFLGFLVVLYGVVWAYLIRSVYSQERDTTGLEALGSSS